MIILIERDKKWVENFAGKRSHVEEEEIVLQKKKIRMNLRYIVRKLDGNGQGWCVMLDFDISCVEPFGSALRLFSSSAFYPATF